MNLKDLVQTLGIEHPGEEMLELISDLYPICRSITGNGLRETLDRIGGLVPLERREIPSGTEVFDWTVPREWNIRDAWIKDPSGKKVVDFQRSNLHVVNYSSPVRSTMSLEDLRGHLHSIPESPDWIPFRTTYYDENWGFCLSHKQLESLEEGEYEVCIDSTLEDGHLSMGEVLIPGEIEDEVLISSHVCHPSICNDNLSGIAVATTLARYVAARRHRYSYRFVFAPTTIGAIAWLALNEERLDRIRHGFVLVSLGDASRFTFKRTRRGDRETDRMAEFALKRYRDDSQAIDFFPWGYDERQYGSPGLDLPVAGFMRGRHNEYPEYHTSGDNVDFMSAENLEESLEALLAIFNVIEGNRTYLNLCPKAEPQLGKRGLYRKLGGKMESKAREMAMLWILNMSDGTRSLVDIADRSGFEFDVIRETATLLEEHGLLREVRG